jgi:hypothetical protein
LITAHKGRTRLVAAVGVLGGVLSLTALGGTSNAATGGNDAGNHPKPQARADQAAATQEASDARIMITPRQGAYDVGINDSVKVTVSNGKLTKVTMTAVATGAEVPGTLSADGTSWKPNGRLERATKYQVAAEAEDAKGRSVTGNATITTVSPANNFIGHLSPEDGSTVGVGMPVTVNFDKAISNKAVVESKIQVSSSSGQQVVGHWFNDDRLDFRPKKYWKPGSTVTVTLNLHGIQKTVTFKIGRSQISTVDAKTKQMTVVRDGKTIKTIPISSGSPEHPTYNGQMVIDRRPHEEGRQARVRHQGRTARHAPLRLGHVHPRQLLGCRLDLRQDQHQPRLRGPEGRQGRRRQAARRVVLRQLDDR